MSSPQARSCCFEIGGRLALRLIGASALDCARVSELLGPCTCPPSGRADVVLRFVPSIGEDHLPALGPYLCSEAGCLILTSRDRRSRARVDLRRLGEEESEILCEGPPDAQLLAACLEAAAMHKGLLVLHASAFVYKNQGIVATGWARGGKTSALLAFLVQGARYITDDKVMISADGRHMWGMNPKLQLSERHLRALRVRPRTLSSAQLLAMGGIHQLDRLNRALLRRRLLGNRTARITERLLSGLKNRLALRVNPRQAFGVEPGSGAVPEKIFVMLRHRHQGIQISPLSAGELFRRIDSVLEHEQLWLREVYLTWKFAFPESHNPFLEHLNEIQAAVACRALRGKQAYLVRHPSPSDLKQLFGAIAECIEGD